MPSPINLRAIPPPEAPSSYSLLTSGGLRPAESPWSPKSSGKRSSAKISGDECPMPTLSMSNSRKATASALKKAHIWSHCIMFERISAGSASVNHDTERHLVPQNSAGNLGASPVKLKLLLFSCLPTFGKSKLEKRTGVHVWAPLLGI